MRKLCENVLDLLYQSIGRSEYSVLGWGKRTKGYGIKPIEFDKFHGCSRSIFYKCRQSLLNQKLIDVIKTDKTKRTDHKPRYTITLLGIIKLFQTKPLGKVEFDDILEKFSENYDSDDGPESVFYSESVDYNKYQQNFLGLWYGIVEKNQPKDVYKSISMMFKGIKPSILHRVFGDIFKRIEIRSDDNETSVSLSINISQYNRVTLWKFIFEDDVINCVLAPDRPEFPGWGSSLEEATTLKEFYFHLIEFVLGNTWFILSKYHSEELSHCMINGISLSDHVDDFSYVLEDMVSAIVTKE